MRSMGAAAVFETAAETPPTVGACQHCLFLKHKSVWRYHLFVIAESIEGSRLM